MNDYGLTDLIVDEQQGGSNNKIKGALTIVAMIIIILLVGILLVKMIIGSPDEDIGSMDANKSEIVDKELVQIDDKKEPTNDDELSPIGTEALPKANGNTQPKIDAKKPKEEVKKKLKIEFNDDTSPTPTKTSKPKEVIKLEADTKKPEIKKPEIKKPKPPKIQKPKDVDHIPATEPKKKPIKPSQLFAKGAPVYYIQVGAFNRDPDAKYLKAITSNGFKYIISQDGETRRVRIGPFKTHAEANVALEGVREKVAKDAFVIKRKHK